VSAACRLPSRLCPTDMHTCTPHDSRRCVMCGSEGAAAARASHHDTATKKLRIVTWWDFRLEIAHEAATPADFPLHDCTTYRGLHARPES
jgi:hypothetical protein